MKITITSWPLVQVIGIWFLYSSPLNSLWGACMSFGTLWDTHRLLLSLLGPAFGPLWGALGRPLILFGSLRATLASLVGCFWTIVEGVHPEGGAQSRFFAWHLQRTRRSGTYPRISLIPQIPRIGFHQLSLGTSLLRAPGVRMT
jgi:hypothetical protein